jgi:serine/threonine protein phosphatase PrpC
MKFSIVRESRNGARRYNQDRVGHWRAPEALLIAVADGMGGYAGGELAAQVAVDFVADAFLAEATPRLDDPDAFLLRTMGRVHGAIVQRGMRAGLGDSPRTTLVACVVQAGRAYWSFIGDSRLYLIREGRIAARTKDHTYVQQLIDAGRIREEAAASHPERNKLLRCLGGTLAPKLEPTASARLAKDDILVLCSDGLWGPLTPRQLLMGFIGKAPARALPELMTLAEAHAGPGCDNISAVAMQWQEETVPETLDLDLSVA